MPLHLLELKKYPYIGVLKHKGEGTRQNDTVTSGEGVLLLVILLAK